MTGDSFDHLVIASSQIKLDRCVFPEPVRFVVARLLVLHLLFDGAHFLSDDAIADRPALGVSHDRAVRSLEPVQVGL